jgi:drug/metabolite transporter (DMT)-like permease
VSDGSGDRRWRAYLALALAINGTAWSAILVRWAGVPGAASGFYRTFIAGLVLVPWWLLRRKERALHNRPLLLALAGGAFFALDLALYNTAVLRTNAAIAALLGNLTPIFVGFMTWMFLRRRPRAAFWIGLTLAIAGCGIIVGVDARRSHVQAGSVEGDVLALIASVFFAAYLMTTERVRRAMDTLTFNTVAISGSTVTLLIISAIHRHPLIGYSMRTWIALLALGLISQLGAYLGWSTPSGIFPRRLRRWASWLRFH